MGEGWWGVGGMLSTDPLEGLKSMGGEVGGVVYMRGAEPSL